MTLVVIPARSKGNRGITAGGGGGGGGQPHFVFTSAFTTATGTGSSAVLDTGVTPHWDSNNGIAGAQVFNTGVSLGFPTVNVLRVPATGSSCDVRVESASNKWAAPSSNGNSIFRRHYFRLEVPNSYGDQDFQSFHPFEPEPGSCPFQWENQIHVLGNGTWDVQLKTPSGNDYIATGLNKFAVYRLELRQLRISAGTYQMDIRIFNSSNSLVKQASDFSRTGQAPNPTLDNDSYGQGSISDACIFSWNVGTNGPGGSWDNITGGDSFIYMGGFAVSDQDWCGPYVNGEHAS